MVKGVFGWVVGFGKACGLWKTCCGKTAVGKAENRLVRAAVSFVPSAVAEEKDKKSRDKKGLLYNVIERFFKVS
jgi:hypothetical protein